MRSVLAAIAAVVLSAHAAAAQNFPNRSLTLVVAAAAGGTTNVLARIVAKRMGEDLGQSVVVENVPGGGATVGTRRVVRADADGYTLIFGNMGSLAANVWLFPQLGFDPRKDLAPVGLVAVVPMVLAVSKQSGIRDLPGFVATLRAKPGALNFGHAGPGTTGHLAREPMPFQCRDFGSVLAPRARWAEPSAILKNWRSYKLRDDEVVPLICPTCQNVFAGA